jgi:DNA polymerase I-like protein with 3'-5' exonuclease and polymerase domains
MTEQFNQLPLFEPASSWVAPALSSLPSSWADVRRVAVDVETRDPDLKRLGPGVRRGAYMVGIAFAIEDGPAAYLPFRHEGPGNLPAAAVLAYVRDRAAEFRGDVVGANLAYDLDFLASAGIEFPRARFFRDVFLADPLIDELQDSYSLENIARRHGLDGKDEVLLREAATAYGVDPKGGLWALPARHVGPYAERDARLPLALLRRQERIITDQELWGVWDLESRLLPVLVRMRRRGVRIDFGRLAEVERWALAEETAALDRVYASIGVRIPMGAVWQAELLAVALRAIGVEPPKTDKGKPSVEAAFLEKIDHDVARALVRARRVNKVRTTFVASLREHAVAGRVHCSYNQLRAQKGETEDLQGAAYGRLSSVQPNLQQQPARDPEIGPLWRSVYVPDDGRLWAALDYSAQEPRMTVHYASITGCRGAETMVARYRADPATDLHQAMADLAGIKRKEAKTIFLGLCYGMGGAKLCRKLGLSTEWKLRDGKQIEVAGPEGRALLERFDELVPFVRGLSKVATLRAETRGFVRTLSGRRCRFPRRADGKFDWTHKALNRLIQGSSADQTKAAMVALDAAGFELQLQVHDEIDLSVRDRAEAEAIARIMETCTPLAVPSRVDVEIGTSWGTAC